MPDAELHSSEAGPAIGVFGSKPDPVIPGIEFDSVYAANAALAQVQSYSSHHIVSILSGYVFGESPEAARCWEHIRGCRANFVHIVNSNSTSDRDIHGRVKGGLGATEFESVLAWSRFRLVCRVLGWSRVLRIVCAQSGLEMARDMTRILRGVEPRSLRVSTGVYALCYAMDKSEDETPTYYECHWGLTPFSCAAADR